VSAADPVLTDARRRMAAAAAHFQRGLDELLPAMRALEQHPDFERTERLRKAGRPSREALTLAWWIHQGLHSTLEDMSPRDAPWCLRENEEATMALFIRTEEQDLRRIARRRRGRGELRRRPGRGRAIAPKAGQAIDVGILRAGHGREAL